MNPNNETEEKVYRMEEGKFIRGVVFLSNGTMVAIMGLLQVMIFDTATQWLIKILKRISPPKHLTPISPNSLLVHFSDNQSFVYQCQSFQPIYTIIGIPNDHKSIKASKNGKYLLYGNNTALQVWNVDRCCIEMLTHQFKYVSCYEIAGDGGEVYLGCFGGEVLVVRLVEVRELGGCKVPYSTQIKPTTKCILSITTTPKHQLSIIDITLCCYLLNPQSHTYTTICKLDPVGSINKPVTFIHSQVSNKLYFHANQYCYRIGLDGQVELIGKGQDVGLVRMGDGVGLGRVDGNCRVFFKQV